MDGIIHTVGIFSEIKFNKFFQLRNYAYLFLIVCSLIYLKL